MNSIGVNTTELFTERSLESMGVIKNTQTTNESVTDQQFLLKLKVLLRKSQLLKNNNKQQAVIFDIDGTLVHEHTWSNPIWSVINFCNYCKEIGIATIIVTARPAWDKNIELTKNALKKLGLNCDLFFFRKPDYEDLNNFKLSTRHYISTCENYNVLMSIGDNVWDIGEYGGTGILMKTTPYTNKIEYSIHD
jgi:predicted secreted acid phosphatase